MGLAGRLDQFVDAVEDDLDLDVLALVFPLELIQILQYRGMV